MSVVVAVDRVVQVDQAVPAVVEAEVDVDSVVAAAIRY